MCFRLAVLQFCRVIHFKRLFDGFVASLKCKQQVWAPDHSSLKKLLGLGIFLEAEQMLSCFLGKKMLLPRSCLTFPSGTTMSCSGKFLSLKMRQQLAFLNKFEICESAILPGKMIFLPEENMNPRTGRTYDVCELLMKYSHWSNFIK